MILLKQILLEISDSAKQKIKLKWKKENKYLTNANMDYYIKVFEKYSAKSIFPKKDIFQYTFKELEHIIDVNFSKDVLKSGSENFTVDENDVIYNEDNLLILKIMDKSKSIQYGQNYDWCISRPDSSNLFYSYRLNHKITFYFIFNKDLPKENSKHSLVLLIYPNGKYSLADSTNAGDFTGNKEFSWEQIVEIEPKLTGLQDLLKSIPPTDEEIKEYDFFSKTKTTKRYSKFTYDQKYKYISIHGKLNVEQLENTPKELQNFYIKYCDADNISKKHYSVLDSRLQKSFFNKWCKRNGIEFDGQYYNSNTNIYIPDFLVQNGKLLIQFGIVKGDFVIGRNGLVTLEGCPKQVNGDFDCSYNELTSLEGCPEYIGGSFICEKNGLTTLKDLPKKIGRHIDLSRNELTSLHGSPKRVNGYFSCANNRLTTLNGSPKIVRNDFNCSLNRLESLEGGPEKVGGDFSCAYNNLTSLKGSPIINGGYFYCSYNKLTTLEGSPKKTDGFYCSNNKLTSLQGCPNEVNGTFACRNNKKSFTYEDVQLYCKSGIYTITF